jgi:DNA-directed RNA polymerase
MIKRSNNKQILKILSRQTLQQRLDYANSILEDILDSADRPLDGRLWWQKSEEKWQTLACCMEIANATRSANPAEYVSHYPIHQDGSCNGLQHYAALGRDKEGAISVNLAPSDKPQDVYSTVLEIIEEERKNEEQSSELAKILSGHIKRKVCLFLFLSKIRLSSMRRTYNSNII